MLRTQTATRALRVTASSSSSRSVHTHSVLLKSPKKLPFDKYRRQVYRPAEGLEKISTQYTGSTFNYNEAVFGAGEDAPARNERSNVELTMKLLQQQLKAAGPNAKNVMVSPVTLARALASDPTKLAALNLSPESLASVTSIDYSALIEELSRSGDLTLNVSTAADADASKAFSDSIASQSAQRTALGETQLSHLVKLPFPLNQTAADLAAQEPIVPYTTHAVENAVKPVAPAADVPLTHALNFRGYLAPKFASPLSKYPNFFYDFRGEKKIAHMMVKASKMWYVEHEKFQMIDLPYLNSNFVATLVLPRISADRTIQDHPDEFAYDNSPRSAATVHEVIELFTKTTSSGADIFSHHAKYMQLMKGLVGMPGFQADHSVAESSVTGASPAAAPAVHRSVFSISPHGLDVGARTPRQRPGQVTANFTALFDHPFLFFLRSTSPDRPQILFAGVVNDVFERHDWATKFPLPAEWTNYKEQVGEDIQKMYSKVL